MRPVAYSERQCRLQAIAMCAAADRTVLGLFFTLVAAVANGIDVYRWAGMGYDRNFSYNLNGTSYNLNGTSYTLNGPSCNLNGPSYNLNGSS